MTREELFDYIQKIGDLEKDHAKLLSTLHYTHFYLMDRYKKILQEYDLTLTQSNVLAIIVHNYPALMSLEEIKVMVLEPSADVSRTVVRLMEKGFVKKVINKKNRRKVCIQATSAGVNITTRLQADKRFREITSDFTLTEAKNLIKLLKKLRT
jgi:DNA-binding MarR family transcriptional regulator